MKRIMVVGDEPDIQTIAGLALESLGGFIVQTCSSGAEALATALGFAPDLILLNVMMPDMDGPSTLAALRATPALAEVSVIFMTAKVQSHEVAQYRAIGALGVGVIPKPFDPMTLADSIRQMWKDTFSG